MKFKKLISLFATFAITSAMITLPVKAAVNFDWHMDESAVNSAAHSAPAQNAYAGKEYGYTYGFTGNTTYIGFTESFDDNSKKLPLPENYQSYEGYMLISMNVYSPAGQQFQFQAMDGAPITPNYTVTTANGFSVNKWNKMLAVVKLSATQTNRTGYWYINGSNTKSSYNSAGHLMFSSETYNKVRLKTNKNSTALYIDDVHVAFTTDALTDEQLDALAAMPTLTTLSGSTVTVGSVDRVTGNVTVAKGTTLANLQAKNTNTLTAYTDSTFTTTVAPNTALQDGDVIIATDSLGKMSYFNVDVVGENYSWWHMDESAVNSGANSYVTQNNLAGKGNGYTYCYKNATWMGFTGSFKDNSKKLTIPANYTSYEGYMLISMNVYSSDEQQFWFTDGSAKFTKECVVTEVNNFSKSKWNKVLAVVQLSTDGSKRISYYYINGIKSGNLGSTYEHNLFASSSSKEIRLATGTSSRYLYIDDVYVTFVPGTLTDEQLDALAAMPTLGVTSDAYVTGNNVDVLSNVTPANLQAKNANTVTAYTDSTFATPVASGTALSAGNIVISTDSFGKMSYYDVTANNAPYVKDSGATVANYTAGNMTFGRKLFVGSEKDLMVIAAQYSSDEKELKKFTSKTDRYSGYVDLSEDLGITETQGTKVKLFVWQKLNDGYSAFCNPISYNP